MGPRGFRKVEKLYRAALGRPAGERDAFLEKASHGDEGLLAEVRSLLGYEEEAQRLLEEPVGEAATQKHAPLRGTRLGPYEVLELIGAGGMGEVYRARDPRLGREVAIKVLHAAAAADTDQRRRFEREARSAAALNHPNIATIHEIESADGIDFIVMEYVPGKSLDVLIPRQGMRLPEVLRLAIPMADALARAHARGIVHRDLKPANVVVSSDGVVKILDFGLAKLIAGEEVGNAPEKMTGNEAASPLSHPGAVAGTAGYMSPEQATAGRVDARSDVFSFGAVLYEMVTGRRAFEGSSTAETLEAVVKEQPKAPSEMVPGVPKELDRLILRCMQKDPDRRFHHMLDVSVELNEIKEESEAPPAFAAAGGRWRRWPKAAIGSAALLAVGAWLTWRSREPVLPLPQVVPLTSLRGSERHPAFSPDGGQIAFSWEGEEGGNRDIYLKPIGSSEVRRLTADPAEDGMPSWSPDGHQIAFVRRRSEDLPSTIYLVSPVAGSDRKLSNLPAAWSHPSWSPDGRWLAVTRYRSPTETDSRAGGISLIPARGGEALPITSPKAPAEHLEPTLSPDGRHLAYVSCPVYNACHVETIELGRDYVPTGPPRRLTRRAGYVRGLAWSRDGSSVIYCGDVYTSRRLWRAWIEGDRPPEKIELAGLGAISPATVASSDRLAFAQNRDNYDIYRFEVGHPPHPLLVSSFQDYSPSLSPNGRRIVFESGRAGDGQEIWLANVDGSNPTQLTHGPGIWQGSPRWSPDAQRIAFDSQGEDGQWHIWTIDTDGGSARRLTLDPGNQNMPSFSRDGRWIYFQSDQAARTPTEVWRIPATGGSEEQVTHGGGTLAHESADGETLFFMRDFSDAPLLALPLAGGPQRKVLDCVPEQGFAVGLGGVYHYACETDPSGTPLYLFDRATGRDRLLGNLKGAGFGPVSADGKAVFYSRYVEQGSDLVMIENFR